MTNAGRRRFALRPVATAATALAVAVFGALGSWQLDRAAEKRGLAADFARPGPALPLPPAGVALPRYHRIAAAGRYDAAHQILLDNRSQSGRAGVEVLTPLLLADGTALLVNRGWLPFGDDRTQQPEVAVGTEPRRIAGRHAALPRAPIELASPPAIGWPRLVSYPNQDELARMLGRELRPGMILLDPADAEGYGRDWSLAGTTAERHLGYAMQWFALAATAVAIWLALSVKRRGESG
ncbi:MAG: SURF1 family protein [Gammaproteobacteria bacterium]